eukprot:Skav205221  [mRNA]  locus=scaffold400:245269:258863:- [translate_table: standard]
MLQEEVERRVEAAGGKVGPAVGQRTSYLVMGGKTIDGRSPEESPKYQRLLQLQKMGKCTAQVLSEAEFLKLLPAASSPAKHEAAKLKPAKVEAAKVEAAMTASPSPPSQQRPSQQKPSQQKPSQQKPGPEPAPGSGPPFNWVDVFAPFQLNQLIGNSAVAQRLADWLQSWDAVVLQGRKKTASPSPRPGSFENVNAVRHTCEERQNMFFVDYSMVGLLVHENYLRAVEKKPASLEVLNRCAYSADLMTVGDIFQQRINSEQGYPGFPAALGKMSRLLMELQAWLVTIP